MKQMTMCFFISVSGINFSKLLQSLRHIEVTSAIGNRNESYQRCSDEYSKENFTKHRDFCHPKN